MPDILIVGSINMDVVALAPHHPVPGETVLGTDLSYIPGGKGSNQAVAAARAGGRVRLLGRLGEDAFGEALLRFLQAEALNTQSVQRLSGIPTGVAIITVSASGENTIVVVPGANGRITPADVDALGIQRGDLVVSQLEIPFETVAHAFQQAKARGAATLLNPSPAAPLPEGLLANTDYLVLNEIELAYYAQQAVTDDHAAVIAAAQRLRAHPQQTLIVTLGGRGVLVAAPSETVHEPAFRVTVVDTTGAGDCFTGALAVALSEGQPLAQAVHFANAAAALSVQVLGASASLPARAAIEQMLAQG
ncbi:ribokinase [Aggregatilineales bacterium SYSU G02658]